jgi:hypothetical protein
MHNGKAGNPSLNRISFHSRRQQSLQGEAKAAWYGARQDQRYAAIIDAIQNNPKMTKVEDRKIVATNLGQLLNRLERAGFGKKKEVLRAANMGDPNNPTESTKQLFNYTLPSFDPSSAPDFEKRISKLVRRTSNYRKLAERAADIAGWNKKGALIDLFKGSSYDVSEQWMGPVPNLPDYLFEVARIVDGLGKWLIQKTRIEWYYQELAKWPVSDEWGNFIFGEPHSPPIAPSDLFKVVTEKVIPGVVLYRMLAAELPVDFVSPETMNKDWADEDWVGGEPPADAVEPLRFRRYFEVRLGIAPVGFSGRIGLVFDQRCVDELWDEDGWRAYLPTLFHPRFRTSRQWDSWDAFARLDPPVGVFATEDAARGDREPLLDYLVRFKATDDNSIPPYELSEDTRQSLAELEKYPERLYRDQLVEEVDPRTCRKYLCKALDKVHCSLKGELSTVTNSPAGTIAAQIEANLSEQINEADRLDTLMLREVEHRCSLLATCIQQRQNLAGENTRKIFSRWASTD